MPGNVPDARDDELKLLVYEMDGELLLNGEPVDSMHDAQTGKVMIRSDLSPSKAFVCGCRCQLTARRHRQQSGSAGR